MDYIAIDELVARLDDVVESAVARPQLVRFHHLERRPEARVLFELRIARWQRAASACKASGQLREWSDAARLD